MPSVGNKVTRTQVASSTELFSSEADYYNEEPRPQEDFTGKTIYQRTFYRLSPDSQVQLPNAVMIEERLRFLPDTENPGYILPVGPRTLIVRQGSEGEFHTHHSSVLLIDSARCIFFAQKPGKRLLVVKEQSLCP